MDTQSIINAVTPVLAPMITAVVKAVAPKLPTWTLPIICTVLGGAGNWIASFALTHSGNVWAAIGLGLAGIGVREVVDQLKPAPTA